MQAGTFFIRGERIVQNLGSGREIPAGKFAHKAHIHKKHFDLKGTNYEHVNDLLQNTGRMRKLVA